MLKLETVLWVFFLKLAVNVNHCVWFCQVGHQEPDMDIDGAPETSDQQCGLQAGRQDGGQGCALRWVHRSHHWSQAGKLGVLTQFVGLFFLFELLFEYLWFKCWSSIFIIRQLGTVISLYCGERNSVSYQILPLGFFKEKRQHTGWHWCLCSSMLLLILLLFSSLLLLYFIFIFLLLLLSAWWLLLWLYIFLLSVL